MAVVRNRMAMLGAGAMALLASGAALAQESVVQPVSESDLAARIDALTKQAAAAQSAADNAWIMVSSALVLMMTAPGLIMFYGGLVRSKNILSVFIQGFFLMSIVSILWLLFGYSIAFAPGNPFIGGLDYIFLKGVGGEMAPLAPTIPHQSFMFFQLMFAIITPGLMVGAFAERFRFKALAVFMILWVSFIYFPLAHMVWGPEGALNAFAEGSKIKALDFAGGTVVHISSGVSALVLAIYLGKRNGYPGKQFVPHNLITSAVGAGLLWVGWFGFNAGSALSAGALASAAFTSTHMSAAGATLTWMLAEWLFRGKPSLLGAISGAVAGLVAVTPAAGFVTPVSGLIIGLIAGFVCWFAVAKVKEIFGYDDALDVFGVHGVGGMLGAILTGVFAHSSVNGKSGLLEGNSMQVVHQGAAVLVTVVLAVVGTLVLIVIVDKVIGARANEEEQEVGLDIVDHGEAAYHTA